MSCLTQDSVVAPFLLFFVVTVTQPHIIRWTSCRQLESKTVVATKGDDPTDRSAIVTVLRRGSMSLHKCRPHRNNARGIIAMQRDYWLSDKSMHARTRVRRIRSKHNARHENDAQCGKCGPVLYVLSFIIVYYSMFYTCSTG